MDRVLRIALVVMLAWGIAIAARQEMLFAAEPEVVKSEVREYRIQIDGKDRGSAAMRISQRADGTEMMQGKAAISVNYIVYKYQYASSATEVWKDGRLLKLTNDADYNGTKYTVAVSPDEKSGQLRLTVNDKPETLAAESWPTSYWRLPEPFTKQRAVRLLDADLGKQMKGELKFVAVETVDSDAGEIDCSRFKITGDVEVDLWFDEARRMVRQESVEMGYRTVVTLTKLRRS